MLESLNTNTLEYQKLSKEEMAQRGILGRLVGVIADCVSPTRNGRHYSEDLWSKVFENPIVKEKIENGVFFGELSHPADREETDPEKICVCMPELPKKGSDGKLRAVLDILDTPNGRILKALCDYGSTLGISSRGSGDLIEDFDGNESVDPDTYNCEGFDIVLVPAVKEARLKYVTESLDKKRYNKTLRTRLQEAILKESEDNQKTMKDSLDNLGIDLDAKMDADFGDDLSLEDNISIDDMPLDDLDNSSVEDENTIYHKGIKILHSPRTDKYYCEIDGESYTFNNEKNAKIWIDMNVKSDSLTEEQVGREDRPDKNIDDVVEPEVEEKPKKEKDDDKVTITFKEAYGDNVSENVINQFISDCIEKFKYFGDRTDIELEIPDNLDTDLFWMDLNSAARDKGIYLSLQEREEIDDNVYLYFYISKSEDFASDFEDQLASTSDTFRDEVERRQDRQERQWDIDARVAKEEAELEDANKSDWEKLNGTEQFAVEAVLNHIKYNGMTEPLEDLVRQACNMYNEVNALEEDEPYSAEEAHDDNVYNYIMKNHSDMLHESLTEDVDDIQMARVNLCQLLDDWYDQNIANEKASDAKKAGWDSDLQQLFINFRNELNPDFIDLEEPIETEVDNIESDIDGLREMLERNSSLEKQITDLQEKLSVSYAMEKKLNEDVESYKEKISKLSKNSKNIKSLTEQLTSVKDSAKVNEDKLNESKKNIKTLTEKLNKVTSERDKSNNELKTLKEDYEVLNRDLNQTKDQFSKKFERQNKLLEKYQKITKNAVDKYINVQATHLGVKPAEIRNRLSEKFSFNDIDSICEDLRDYKLNVSMLPFNTGSSLNEGINAKAVNIGSNLLPKNEVDDLTDYDRKLMEAYL